MVVIAVRLLGELAGERRTVYLATDRAGKLADDAEAFVRPAIARRLTVAFTGQRPRRKLDLKRRLADREQEHPVGRLHWCRGLLVATENVDHGFLLVVVDRELHVVFPAAPVSERAIVRARTVAMVIVIVRVAMV